MNEPYNTALANHYFRENARKLAPLLLAVALICTATSCRKAAIATVEQAAGRPASEAILEADKLYSARPDLAKVRQGIIILRQAQAEDQANYELVWRLSKFNYYLGAHSPDSTERDKAFHDGVEAGRAAVKLQDSKPEGHFWLGANYGGKAQNSVLAGLSEIDDIKREMETVIKLDEGYQSGSAYMALGQVYLETPGLLGGDTQRAISFLEKGLRLGPDNSLLRAHLAEAYVEAHRNDDARKQIDALQAMKPAPGYEPEHNEALAEVKKLQEKIK